MMAVFVTATLRSVEFLLVFGTTLYCISNACQTCNSRWEKVYENDADGNDVWGDKSEVVNVNTNGARVKYMIPELGEEGLIEEPLVNYVSYGDFYGRSLPQVNKDRWDHFLDDGQWKFIQISTQGSYEKYTLSLGSTDFYNYEIFYVGIVWYVMKSCCLLPMYTHDSAGGSLLGSKDKLKYAVMSGFDVRVKVIANNFFSLMNNIEISPIDDEVVGQLVWDGYNSGGLLWDFGIFSTSGHLSYQIWLIGEHTVMYSGSVDIRYNWYVEPCWRHSFTHDENGVEQDGSLVDLIAAVEQGHRVRVLMGTYATEVNNMRIKDGQVSGQILNEIGRKESDHVTFIDDNFWIWHMVHTTGTVSTRRYSIGNTTHRGDSLERRTISWFVDTHPWKKVLSTNKLGIVTFGSKADLKHALENGASVGIGLQFDGDEWFYMTVQEIEFGHTGEIAAELIKSVGTEEVGGGEFQIKDDPFWKFMLVTTQGDVDIAQWRVGDHVNDGHFSDKANVIWFVSNY